MGTDVTELFIVITVIAVALIFDYTNGFHDSANAMAGPIATGALRPRTAVILGAFLNLVGACLSTAVAKTISGGLFDDELITASIILAGLVGAIVWNLMTWLFGLPSSSSHALFGGLIGAVVVGAGIASVHGWVIVSKVLLPAVVAPLVAGIAAAWATRLAYRITRRTPSVHTGTGFKYGQAFTSSMVALAHGTSDGQKTMGVITLVLIAANLQAAGTGPQLWVIIISALAIGLGTYSGGWRIMRTMGKGIVEIETPQGAASGAATSATILASARVYRQHPGFRGGPRSRGSLERCPPDGLRLAPDIAGSRSGRRPRSAARRSRRQGHQRATGATVWDLPGDLLPLPSPPDHPRQRHRQPRSPRAGCRYTSHVRRRGAA
jgi:inorganic phosphate transporter, PiT family